MSGTGPGHPRFCVLLGPDYAGKSSVLSAFARQSVPWRLLSLDDAFTAPEHALIGRLRRELVKEVAAHPGRWSAEFLTAMLHTAAVHLRDRLLADPAPAVIDSYHYKLLAKCRLAGVPDTAPVLAWWRSFPRPRRVVFLEVSPETAWRRCGHGSALNPLEHYGPAPDWDGFRRYQTDLAKTLRDEIHGLPVTVVAEQRDAAATARAIREVLTRELG
ncbi:hypothetical protein GTU99_27490 [Streptomyces sp. PRKS01-65]|nr:hypothetical protein [Streptomyces harenosi]NEY35858.1 hypothetical protein [Streptomyces harenosi]